MVERLHHKPLSRKGFNLIESAIVLGVVGLVIGGIWVSAATMYENYKVNKTIEDIFLAAKAIQKTISINDSNAMTDAYPYRRDFLKVLFPSWSYVGNPGNHDITTPQGIEVMIYNYNTSSNHFTVNFPVYTTQFCIKILTNTQKNAYGLFKIVTDKNVSGTGVFIATLYNFPVPLDSAESACSNGAERIRYFFPYTRIN